MVFGIIVGAEALRETDMRTEEATSNLAFSHLELWNFLDILKRRSNHGFDISNEKITGSYFLNPQCVLNDGQVDTNVVRQLNRFTRMLMR